MHGFKDVDAEKVLEKGMAAVTEGSAEVAKETDKPEAAAIAEEVHEIVIETVAEAVQKEAEEAQRKTEKPAEGKKVL